MLPRRYPPSAVTSTLHAESLMRSRNDSLLNPPNTTLCDCADAGAGQHGNRQFRDERHVKGHAVALLDAKALEDVGELRHLTVEVEVGQRATVAGLPFPDERGLVAARPACVTIDAVHARVERAADEPLGVRRRPVEHRGPGPEPRQLFRKAGPERLWILRRAVVDARVADVRCLAKRRARIEAAVFAEQRVDFRGCAWRFVGHDADSTAPTGVAYPSLGPKEAIPGDRPLGAS